MNDSLMYIIKVRRYHEPENRAMPVAKSSPKRWWLLILMLGWVIGLTCAQIQQEL